MKPRSLLTRHFGRPDTRRRPRHCSLERKAEHHGLRVYKSRLTTW